MEDKSQIIETRGAPIRAWIDGVPVEEQARKQVKNIAAMHFVHSHVAVMPDVHLGRGATIGSVIPTRGAIIPAAVGVDIGCGMMAWRTSMTADQLPDSLAAIRSGIEKAVPHGGIGPKGGWKNGVPDPIARQFVKSGLSERLGRIADKRPAIGQANHVIHMGSLGTGNHFIELCLDEEDRVWVMLHSGSRGVGNRIGTLFIEEARNMLAQREGAAAVPDRDLAWFEDDEPVFADYVEAVGWAQDFARANRETMMEAVLAALREHLPAFTVDAAAVNCHHNYVAREHHYGADVWVTRKGAVRAGEGEMGIIPGSMGAKSFIVRGKGNAASFCSCSHGAGRAMSRTAARKAFTVEDHALATAGVECRKDKGVIDETPAAYKSIDAVMAAQSDLIDVVHTLKQVVCVKG